ncbi:ABC transporter ATP-binding protein [Bradyrhizobium sp. Leo170]|uniref:ABC transporter ATP-binding protein n=1 Tax=Bradyrhizobium sp. Leo170 TaxID=1571199 RepID=UPI00102E45C9|nr:ABC transporter ATP-binding protein [Bradyrhizobium sp. Leo170]TAI64837.1 ABC transporter ATP-binding protein [Bradyrhizobium sp. Leo170]
MLRIANLRGGYGAGPVLDGVDLVVASGEVVSVVGRNGSGKSTLIKAVMGLLPVALGTIELDGKALLGLPAHQIARRGVAYVPQGRGIFPRLTVRQNLEIGARAAGAKDGIPGDVLELFPFLKERFGQSGGTMSGGEQQMLAIARALASHPRLLLLDEPSDGVQPRIVQEIGELIPEIARAHRLGVILVEQNLDLAMAAASRIVVLDKGMIAHECASERFRDVDVQTRFLAI